MSKKGITRADADVGLMMTAYNMRRIINILGITRLREYLGRLGSYFFCKKALIQQTGDIFRTLLQKSETIGLVFQRALIKLYLSQI